MRNTHFSPELGDLDRRLLWFGASTTIAFAAEQDGVVVKLTKVRFSEVVNILASKVRVRLR